jgi:hypothetical protein
LRISPRARLAAVAIAAATLPALAQERPESILPPGFGEPQPAPSARPSPRPVPSGTPGQPVIPFSTATALPVPVPAATNPVPPSLVPGATPSETPSPAPTIDPATLAEYEMPALARRSLDLVGVAGPAEGGLPADAFGRADGRTLERWMRGLSAPLPSRWMSILLRRTLMSGVNTPAHVNGADFAAERAWLLLRMGEATAARALVQGVDTANYTPKLYDVAANAMLASADPAGLCPLQPRAAALLPNRGWTLAGAMCAALSGQPAAARAQLAAARRRRVATGIDLQLAQKVAGAGPNGGQAVTIEWAGVDRLSAWRFGLATATGASTPDDMLASVGPQVRYWRALAPAVAPADRLSAAEAAAGQGVLSSAALVDLYGALDGAEDVPSAASAVADDLRTAYTAETGSARVAALRRIWGDAARTPYPRLVLTARAAARVPVRAETAEADRLVAAMLSAGLDRTAARWRGVVATGGDAWAMLTLADPDLGQRLTYRDMASYAGDEVKRKLFFAGLAGLGRLSSGDVERTAQDMDVRIGAENAWTHALDHAAVDNQPATVVLLCAIGMQTPAWRGVPPEMLYRMVGALRAVGLGGEARMIAAEAIARA